MAASASPAKERVVTFLGDLGSRWGLPADAMGFGGLIARFIDRSVGARERT